MKKLKSNLDEMQELNLLNIEKRGFWLIYIGLAIAITVQMFLYQEEAGRYIAAEMIVFLGVGIYMVEEGIRKGIWSRRIPATPLANVLQSIGYSSVFAVVLGIIKYVQYGSFSGAVAAAVIFFISMAVICYIVLSLLMVFYKKRKTELENADEEE